MYVLPAIDILKGKVVRLRQGRLDAVTVYNESPVEQARLWVDGGAQWIHVVDLDGAVLGRAVNLEHVAAICGAVTVPVQCGGGVRDIETLRRLFDVGVTRVVLGTALITQPELVAEAVESFGDGIVAGVDARDGKIAIEGWVTGTDAAMLDLITELRLAGVERIAYTDIGLDGTQRGVNVEAYGALAGSVDIAVIASGGVSSLEDVVALARLGGNLEGVIIGTALYERKFTLPEAVQAASGRTGAGFEEA